MGSQWLFFIWWNTYNIRFLSLECCHVCWVWDPWCCGESRGAKEQQSYPAAQVLDKELWREHLHWQINDKIRSYQCKQDTLTISCGHKWRDVITEGVYCLNGPAPITGHKHSGYQNKEITMAEEMFHCVTCANSYLSRTPLTWLLLASGWPCSKTQNRLNMKKFTSYCSN